MRIRKPEQIWQLMAAARGDFSVVIDCYPPDQALPRTYKWDGDNYRGMPPERY